MGFAACMMPLVSHLRADEFEDERLRAGANAYAAKRYAEAIDQLRIAAFGSLDRPVVLSESLVRLSLAQAAFGKDADARATLDRFLDVERRFAVFAKANLQPEIRAAFTKLLLSRVPQPTILSIPSLASLIETEEQKIARLPPSERKKALEAAARREPGNPVWPLALSREALERGDANEAEKWASRALDIESRNVDALTLRIRARTSRGSFADALADLSSLTPDALAARPELYADDFVCLVEVRNWDAAAGVSARVPEALSTRADVVRARAKLAEQEGRAAAGDAPKPAPSGGATAAVPASSGGNGEPHPDAARSRAALEEARRLITSRKAGEAEKILGDAVKVDPGNRDLRLALLEAACLSRSYQSAAAQIPLVQPFQESEMPSMFYAAVALFETGKSAEARVYFERCSAKVTGPMVDEYAKKILGRS